MIRFFKSKHFPEFSNNFTQICIILINKNDATFKFLWDLYIFFHQIIDWHYSCWIDKLYWMGISGKLRSVHIQMLIWMSSILFEFRHVPYINRSVNILVLFETRYGIPDFLPIKFYCHVYCCIGFFFHLSNQNRFI